VASHPNSAEILAKLPRNAVHDMIEMLIERLDLEDGDPDLEETDAEDSFVLSWYASKQSGPGCPISDPGGGNVEDGGEAEEGE
jgi:hypothetical protein